jgi:pimeloyl-ACP methyl ester carboxylesterase
MYIHESGSRKNPMILFLHADGSTGLMWQKHFAALSNYYCVAPDMRGFGKSNHTPWTTLDRTTEEMKEIILQSSHKKAHVVGLSLGASVAINLLSKHCQYVDHAVIDGAGVIPMKGVSFVKAGVAAVSPFIHNDFVIRIMVKALGLTQKKISRHLQKT